MNTQRQFLVLSALVVLSNAATTPWPGPFADHMLGRLVEDTPEVVAAKRQHAEAHSQVRAILPELPQEERFPEPDAPVIVPQFPVVIPQIPVVIPQRVRATPTTVKPQFAGLAEEVPRSAIGETPEVEAARKAHLEAVTALRGSLPPFNSEAAVLTPIETSPANVPAVYVPADTPEVAAAKLEHARAYGEALKLVL